MAGAVGLIGIGLMGTALARRLLDAGYRVIGFDIASARRGVKRSSPWTVSRSHRWRKSRPDASAA
jgi:3-hydroxyisobutyrate dehydrogenase-like beta-hydroxyacid dehydrogenase